MYFHVYTTYMQLILERELEETFSCEGKVEFWEWVIEIVGLCILETNMHITVGALQIRAYNNKVDVFKLECYL